MSRKILPEASDVFERLKSALDIEKDEHLAKQLGVSTGAVYASRSRNSLNHGRVAALCLREDISLDWLYGIDAETPAGPEGWYVERVRELETETAELRGRLAGMADVLTRLGIDLPAEDVDSEA